MSVKCPACGFDSPDGAPWCELCKEPFKKKGTAAAVEELKKLPPDELLKRLPTELSKDAAREQKIPSLPPWFRPLAYAFLLFMVVTAAILMMMASSRARSGPPPQQLGSP